MLKRQKNIVHLIATNFYGGPERQIIEHLRRLNNECFNGIVASFLERNEDNELLKKARENEIENYSIPISHALDFSVLRLLVGLLREKNADLLCTHGYKSTVLGWLAAKKAGIPVLAFSRGYTSENMKVSFYEWIERRVLGNTDGVICVSEGQRRKLERLGVDGKRFWTVHNAISAPEVFPADDKGLKKAVYKKFGIPEHSVLVVSAGRFSPEKGYKYLLEAISRLDKSAEESVFLLCGDGDCRKELEDLMRKLSISGKCMFAGFRRDLNDIFKAMDLLVLPSLTEGLPNVVLEAFACAKPVVATEVGGVPEIVENGVNGFLVPPASPGLLADAMMKCIASSALRSSLGQSGYKTIRSRFTYDEQTGKLEAIYNEILNTRGNN